MLDLVIWFKTIQWLAIYEQNILQQLIIYGFQYLIVINFEINLGQGQMQDLLLCTADKPYSYYLWNGLKFRNICISGISSIKYFNIRLETIK